MEELFKIPIPLYRAKLHVFFGTPEACAEAMRKENVPELEIEEWKKNTKGFEGMYHEDNDFRLLWITEVPATVGRYGELAHEIEHAVFYLLNSRGLKHTEESDEAYSYLTGFLFEEIDSLIVELRDKAEKDGEDNNTRKDTKQGELL